MTRPEGPTIHDKPSDHNEHRMRRAKSWLAQSEKVDSAEEKFICLWIAFNAAYGDEPTNRDEDDGETKGETKRFTKFLKDIIERDHEKKIETFLIKMYSDPIRVLLKNYCVFKPFWWWARGRMANSEWKKKFRASNDDAKRALGKTLTGNENVRPVFEIVFDRLYQLCNQVFHGGVTFKTGYGRSQLEDGARIMEKIVPVILKIMEAEIKKNPDTKIWGEGRLPESGRRRFIRLKQKGVIGGTGKGTQIVLPTGSAHPRRRLAPRRERRAFWSLPRPSRLDSRKINRVDAAAQAIRRDAPLHLSGGRARLLSLFPVGRARAFARICGVSFSRGRAMFSGG